MYVLMALEMFLEKCGKFIGPADFYLELQHELRMVMKFFAVSIIQELDVSSLFMNFFVPICSRSKIVHSFGWKPESYFCLGLKEFPMIGLASSSSIKIII